MPALKYRYERPKAESPSRKDMQELLQRISSNLRRGDIRKAQIYALDLAKQLHSVGLLPDTLEMGDEL